MKYGEMKEACRKYIEGEELTEEERRIAVMRHREATRPLRELKDSLGDSNE